MYVLHIFYSSKIYNILDVYTHIFMLVIKSLLIHHCENQTIYRHLGSSVSHIKAMVLSSKFLSLYDTWVAHR